MIKKLYLLYLFLISYGLNGISQSSCYNADSIIIYSIPWEVTTPVGLSREQVLKFCITTKHIIRDVDTVNQITNEILKCIKNPLSVNEDPDIRVACFIFMRGGNVEEYYFNRQKFMFYDGSKYARSKSLLDLLDNYQ